MKNLWSRLSVKNCDHKNTITVRSVGVQRVVCEKCGHVGFNMSPSSDIGLGHPDPVKQPVMTSAS